MERLQLAAKLNPPGISLHLEMPQTERVTGCCTVRAGVGRTLGRLAGVVEQRFHRHKLPKHLLREAMRIAERTFGSGVKTPVGAGGV